MCLLSFLLFVLVATPTPPVIQSYVASQETEHGRPVRLRHMGQMERVRRSVHFSGETAPRRSVEQSTDS